MGFYPVPSQGAENRPSAALSGRLTLSAAWQGVAPYSSRRHPSSFPVSSTGQACCGVHPSTRRLSVLGPQDFGSSRERDFAKLNLHLGIFEQPQGNHSLSNFFG